MKTSNQFDKFWKFFILASRKPLRIYTIDISEKPTFDLTEFSLKYLDTENSLCFFESIQVFEFNNVYGFLSNRSRVTRINKPESQLVEQIISATIDSGYCGKLVWKTKLTKEGLKMTQKAQESSTEETLIKLFKDCQQIHLFPFTGGNYYSGTNQTILKPEIIFTYGS